MPVTGVAIASAIKANMTPRGIKGRDASSFADAVGTAVALHVTKPNMVSCTLNGTSGPLGSITSITVGGIVSKAMCGMMAAKAQTRKLTGRDITSLFDAISSGVSQVLMTSALSGTCVGCAVGAGTGRFTAIDATALANLIVLNFTAKTFKGRNVPDLADCISFGVVNHLKSGAMFIVTVAGAISPAPPTGPMAVFNIPSVMTKVS